MKFFTQRTGKKRKTRKQMKSLRFFSGRLTTFSDLDLNQSSSKPSKNSDSGTKTLPENASAQGSFDGGERKVIVTNLGQDPQRKSTSVSKLSDHLSFDRSSFKRKSTSLSKLSDIIGVEPVDFNQYSGSEPISNRQNSSLRLSKLTDIVGEEPAYFGSYTGSKPLSVDELFHEPGPSAADGEGSLESKVQFLLLPFVKPSDLQAETFKMVEFAKRNGEEELLLLLQRRYGGPKQNAGSKLFGSASGNEELNPQKGRKAPAARYSKKRSSASREKVESPKARLINAQELERHRSRHSKQRTSKLRGNVRSPNAKLPDSPQSRQRSSKQRSSKIRMMAESPKETVSPLPHINNVRSSKKRIPRDGNIPESEGRGKTEVPQHVKDHILDISRHMELSKARASKQRSSKGQTDPSGNSAALDQRVERHMQRYSKNRGSKARNSKNRRIESPAAQRTRQSKLRGSKLRGASKRRSPGATSPGSSRIQDPGRSRKSKKRSSKFREVATIPKRNTPQNLFKQIGRHSKTRISKNRQHAEAMKGNVKNTAREFERRNAQLSNAKSHGARLPKNSKSPKGQVPAMSKNSNPSSRNGKSVPKHSSSKSNSIGKRNNRKTNESQRSGFGYRNVNAYAKEEKSSGKRNTKGANRNADWNGIAQSSESLSVDDDSAMNARKRKTLSKVKEFGRSLKSRSLALAFSKIRVIEEEREALQKDDKVNNQGGNQHVVQTKETFADSSGIKWTTNPVVNTENHGQRGKMQHACSNYKQNMRSTSSNCSTCGAARKAHFVDHLV